MAAYNSTKQPINEPAVAECNGYAVANDGISSARVRVSRLNKAASRRHLALASSAMEAPVDIVPGSTGKRDLHGFRCTCPEIRCPATYDVKHERRRSVFVAKDRLLACVACKLARDR